MDIRTVDIHEILPQREPFLFCDSIVDYTRDTAATEYAVPAEGLFIENGLLKADALVEIMAQTAAARIGYKAIYIDHTPVRIGFIGSVKNLQILRRPASGELLRTDITILHDVFGISLASARVSSNGETIATSQLKIALSDQEMKKN